MKGGFRDELGPGTPAHKGTHPAAQSDLTLFPALPAGTSLDGEGPHASPALESSETGGGEGGGGALPPAAGSPPPHTHWEAPLGTSEARRKLGEILREILRPAGQVAAPHLPSPPTPAGSSPSPPEMKGWRLPAGNCSVLGRRLAEGVCWEPGSAPPPQLHSGVCGETEAETSGSCLQYPEPAPGNPHRRVDRGAEHRVHIWARCLPVVRAWALTQFPCPQWRVGPAALQVL